MSRKKRRMDLLGALLGVYDVNWTKDFPDDGYRDVLGRAPLDEPLFYGQEHSRAGNAIVIPRLHTSRASGK